MSAANNRTHQVGMIYRKFNFRGSVVVVVIVVVVVVVIYNCLWCYYCFKAVKVFVANVFHSLFVNVAVAFVVDVDYDDDVVVVVFDEALYITGPCNLTTGSEARS